MTSVSSESEQVAGYLKTLIEKYRMVEKRLPIFAPAKARKGRYYLRDNFLQAWMGALQGAVSAVNFRPVDTLVEQADKHLIDAEGYGLERLVAQLYEERARKGVGDFALTHRIDGYWDRNDTEIDLVAANGDDRDTALRDLQARAGALGAGPRPLRRAHRALLERPSEQKVPRLDYREGRYCAEARCRYPRRNRGERLSAAGPRRSHERPLMQRSAHTHTRLRGQPWR